MKIDYEEIRRKNLEEYGKGTRHLSYFSDLYSTRTHFIFELLQNTEDAIRRCSEENKCGFAEFRLLPDRLELRHNGKLFDEHDITGVCGIGEGTKADDFTAIGKFGIGFKSIYAYTSAPQIHSGDQSFEIRRYVQPHELLRETRPPELPDCHTCIVIPFDESDAAVALRKPDAATSIEEISAALKRLGFRTLLFLRHIREIRWHLPDGTKGSFRRESRQDDVNQFVRRVTLFCGDDTEEWVVLERKLSLQDNGSSDDALVEVGFLMRDGKIACASDTDLVVSFPTEKKTGLGFLIQGPFQTTKARDNITKDSEANGLLIEGAAQLAADSLEIFRDAGFLHLESYSALPICPADFQQGSPFRPVYDAIRIAMRTKALLPCHSGGFAVSSEARLARGAGLAELFSSEQLSQLFAVSNAVWLDTAITADKMPDLYRYLCGKKRDIWSGEWEQEPLREGMQVAAADIAGKLNAEFFEHQDDEWVQRFYEYVQGSYQSFRQTPFIRLENGNHVTPGAENTNAYLPPEMGGDIDQTIFPLVKATLALNPECKRFLQETVKLREPNKVDEILQSRICKYREGTLVFDDKSYAVDLDVINAAACNATPPDAERLFKGLREIPFIASVAANGLDAAVVWKKPTDQNLFPSSDDNQLWFIGNDVDKAWFEHSAFQKMIDPEIRRRLSMNSRDKLRKELSNPRWTQWTRRTHVKYEIQAFDPLNTLHGLKWAVTHPSKERALILWKWLLENVGLLKGTGKTSRNAAYPDGNTTSFEGFSVLGIHVSENAWIPTREKDGFFAPTVLGLKDLPEDLHQTSPIAEALSRALGMVQPVSLGPVARAHGLTEDQAHERLSISDEDMKEIRQRRATRKTDFPDDDSPNYELRSKRAEDQAARAPEGEREQRTRMIRKNSDRAEVREYLSQKYTRDGILSCQMSQEPVPFSLQSGEPYFVAVEILPLGKEIPANHLCLSPTCAAEFRHALGTDDDALRARIMEIVTNADQILKVEIDVPIPEHRKRHA